MGLELFDLVTGGWILAFVVMVCTVLIVRRWDLPRMRFEKDVLALTALVMGPLGTLLANAIPLDPPYLAPKTTYLQLGMVILVVQMLFWSAFLRLRTAHLAAVPRLEADRG